MRCRAVIGVRSPPAKRRRPSQARARMSGSRSSSVKSQRESEMKEAAQYVQRSVCVRKRSLGRISTKTRRIGVRITASNTMSAHPVSPAAWSSSARPKLPA
jgi:hypothetical protein